MDFGNTSNGAGSNLGCFTDTPSRDLKNMLMGSGATQESCNQAAAAAG